MFYDSFISICEDAGISPTKVLVDLDISKGSLNRWKEGGGLTNETKKKIADYFGITVKQLMEGKIKKAPVKTEADTELIEMLEDVRRNPDLRVLFSLSKNASPEDVKKTIQMLKAWRGDFDGERDS